MKRIIILLVFISSQLQGVLACEKMPGSTLVEDNITAARIAFFCVICSLLIPIYVMKYYNWKALLGFLLIILFHPYIWFENYADCGYILKFSSILYTIIILLIVFLMVKEKRKSR